MTRRLPYVFGDGVEVFALEGNLLQGIVVLVLPQHDAMMAQHGLARADR